MLTHNRSALSVKFLCGLALALVVIAVDARELRTGNPKREGMSPERLQRITDHMNMKVEKGIMAGGLGMIARNGKIVYQQTYGMADRETGRPMEEDAIFRIYSMTKPIAGVALMMLYEEGHFFLNDPVAKYIPELADLKVAVSTADGGASGFSDGTTSTGGEAGDESQVGTFREPYRQPTIRDLLRHTAGMTYGIFGDTEVDRLYREAELFASPDLAEFVARLGKLPLQYDPGTRWHYFHVLSGRSSALSLIRYWLSAHLVVLKKLVPIMPILSPGLMESLPSTTRNSLIGIRPSDL